MSHPIQDERFRDSGRRTIEISSRPVSAALAKLRADEIRDFPPATHQIVYRTAPGAVARPGATLDYDGQPWTIVRVGDPYPDDPQMRRKFVKLFVSKG